MTHSSHFLKNDDYYPHHIIFVPMMFDQSLTKA